MEVLPAAVTEEFPVKETFAIAAAMIDVLLNAVVFAVAVMLPVAVAVAFAVVKLRLPVTAVLVWL